MDALKEILGQLGIDQTFFYMFGLIWVFFFFFSLVYLKPFQKLLHERYTKTLGAKKDAQDILVRSEEKFAQYKTQLKNVNDEARSILRSSEDVARKEETKLLNEAANKSKASLQNTQIELEKQKKEIVDALAGDINTIASEIATKAMGRSVGTR